MILATDTAISSANSWHQRARRLVLSSVWFVFSTILLTLPAFAQSGLEIVVTTTDDVIDSGDNVTSLREAIILSNNTELKQTIVFDVPDDPAIFTLSLNDEGADTPEIRDLNITDNVTIIGDGPGSTIIDGNDLYQIFNINNGSTAIISVDIFGVTLQNILGDAAIVNFETLTISDSVIKDSAGDGILTTSATADLTVDDCIIQDSGTFGIQNIGGMLSVTDSTIQRNGSSGIANRGGTASLTNSTVSNNTAQTGGGILNTFVLSFPGNFTIDTSTIADNSATNGGGGIWNGLGSTMTPVTMTITNSTIQDNSTNINGGGILNTGPNSNTELTLTNVTLSGNTANLHGGGLANAGVEDGPNAYLNNVTIADNTADVDGDSAGDGGGIAQYQGGRITVRNSIIADNTDPTSDPDCVLLPTGDPLGFITSAGYNLIGTPSTNCVIDGDTTTNISGDPMLGMLASHGGPTDTYSLIDDSPAIDAGNPDGCEDHLGDDIDEDQRGEDRHQDGDGDAVVQCDMGAFESEEMTARIIVNTRNDNIDFGGSQQVADLLSDSNRSLREAIIATNNTPGTTRIEITFDDSIFNPSSSSSARTIDIDYEVDDVIRPLPSLQRGNVIIDGDLDNDTVADVILDGSALPGNDDDGLVIVSSQNTITGMHLKNFPDGSLGVFQTDSIEIGASDNTLCHNVVEGSRVPIFIQAGTDADGSEDVGTVSMTFVTHNTVRGTIDGTPDPTTEVGISVTTEYGESGGSTISGSSINTAEISYNTVHDITQFAGIRVGALGSFGDLSNVSVMGNEVLRSTGNGILVLGGLDGGSENTVDVEVTGNTAENNIRNGIALIGAIGAVNTDGATSELNAITASVNGNTTQSNLLHGIFVAGGQGATVGRMNGTASENTVTATTFSENIASSNVLNGITVIGGFGAFAADDGTANGNEVTISLTDGNRAEDNGGNGIALFGGFGSFGPSTSNGTASFNEVTAELIDSVVDSHPNGTGILLTGGLASLDPASDATANDNVIEASMTLEGNEVTNSGRAGVAVVAGSVGDASANTVNVTVGDSLTDPGESNTICNNFLNGVPTDIFVVGGFEADGVFPANSGEDNSATVDIFNNTLDVETIDSDDGVDGNSANVQESGTVACPNFCGNAMQDLGEECDDGDSDDTDECSNSCQLNPVCGDGTLDSEESEECDDGNTDAGDGCSASCTIETDFFNIGEDVEQLRTAINTANALNVPIEISLAEFSYTLEGVDNTTDGVNGLPSITGDITIIGPGAPTTFIERQVGAAPFRIFHVDGDGSLTLQGVSLSGGQADPDDEEGLIFGCGGGILNHGSLTLVESEVQDSFAIDGGGICNLGTLDFIRSTFDSNHADIDGGGLYNDDDTAATLTNSTVSNNTAGNDGGGIWNTGTLGLFNVTVTQNEADELPFGASDGVGDGGGISNASSGSVSMQHTILAGNTDPNSDPDCHGEIESLGFNLVGVVDSPNCIFESDPTTDQTGTTADPLDPGLAELEAETGDPTQTHALLPGSPAIDLGDPLGCVDQEGDALLTDQIGTGGPADRALDGDGNGSDICDIGAREAPSVVGQITLTVNATNDEDDGVCDAEHCSLREAINLANLNEGQTDTITFNFSGSGPQTITPNPALPVITDPIIINGNSAVVIDGSLAPTIGLEITAGNSTVTGLVINNFSSHGIRLGTNGGNILRGNFIGTNADGTAAASNDGSGIFIDNVPNNTIGGLGAANGNLLSGNNQDGITISGASATGNIIRGNIIGLNAAGTDAMGNGNNGVTLDEGASNNTIGGTANGAANTIAFSEFAGVRVTSGAEPPFSTGNEISGNSIFSNGTLGIDLGNVGVTANDNDDADTGDNNRQNFPVITGVSLGSTTVEGTLNSIVGTDFRIEFFTNTTCDSSNNGEGENFLGSVQVTTNEETGNASFNSTFDDTAAEGEFITATATNLTTNDTSEFSACFTVAAGTLDVALTKSHVGNFIAGTTAEYTLTVTNAGDVDTPDSIFVTDTLPSSLSFVSVNGTGWACGDDGQEVSCELTDSLAVGDSSIITLTVDVAASPPAEISNTATVMTEGDGNIENDVATDVATVLPVLQATKTAELQGDNDFNDIASPGDVLRYTITLSNTGGSAASGLVFTDTPDSNTTLIPGVNTVGEVVEGNEGGDDSVRVEIESLEVGEEITINFDVTIVNPLPAGVTQVSNQGEVTSNELINAELDPVLTEDLDDGGPTVTPVTASLMAGDISFTKTASLFADNDEDGMPSPGDVLLYQIALTNNGNPDFTGVVLTDAPDENANLVVGSVVVTQGTVTTGNAGGDTSVEVDVGTITGIGTTGDSGTVSIIYQVQIPNPLDVTTLTNQAMVTSNELPILMSDDPSVEGDNDPTVTAVTPKPLLTVSKTDDLANDVDEDDLFGPGDSLQYTITIHNQGNADATEVGFTDTPDPNTTIVPDSVNPSQGEVIQGNGTEDTSVNVALGTIAAGAMATIDFDVTLPDPLDANIAQIENQGTVASADSPSVQTDDPDLPGDSDPTLTVVTLQPLLIVSKTDMLSNDADDNGVASPGDTLAYSITIQNVGNSPAGNVVLTDFPGDNTALVPNSVMTDLGEIVTGSAPTDTSVRVEIESLPADGVATVGFNVTIDDPFPVDVDQVSNQGSVSADDLPITMSDDPDTPDEADATLTAITLTPMLTATKTDALVFDADDDGFPSPGDTLEYVVNITNDGNGVAENANFTDTLDANISLIVGSVMTNMGAVSTGNTAGNTYVGVDIGMLPAGATATISFRATIDDPFPVNVDEVMNQGTATAEDPENPEDPIEELTDDPDIAGDDNPTLTVVTSTPLLLPSKTDVLLEDADLSGEVSPGDTIGYVITLLNDGNTAATDVLFTDTPDANTSLVVGSAMTDMGMVTIGNSTGDSSVVVEIESLPAGATATISFSVIVADPFPDAASTVSNQGSVMADTIAAIPTDDPDEEGDEDPTSTLVQTTAEADLVLTKVDDLDPIGAGEMLEYELTVANIGPSQATDVVLVDMLPTGVAFVSSDSTPPGLTCTEADGTVTCDLGTLGVDESVQIFLLVAATTVGTHTNVAIVGATEVDPNEDDNTASETTTVAEPPQAASLNLGFPSTDGFADPMAAFVMFSTPLLLNNITLEDVLGPKIGSDGADLWRVFHYQNGGYIELSPSDAIQHGLGYWVITREGIAPSLSGTPIDASQPFQITLQPGPNQIGTPYNFPIDWANGVVPILPAGVSPALFGYNQGYTMDDVMQPGQGYFVINETNAPVTLTIPPVLPVFARADLSQAVQVAQGAKQLAPVSLRERLSGMTRMLVSLISAFVVTNAHAADMDLPSSLAEYHPPQVTEEVAEERMILAANSPKWASSAAGWRIRLSAESGDVRDVDNYLGLDTAGRVGRDSLDYPEPPFFNGISLYFPHPEWGHTTTRYASDIRHTGGSSKQVWEFEVETDRPSSQITLRWELRDLPIGGFRLHDLTSGRTVDMQNQTEYAYQTGQGGIRRFQVEATGLQ